MKLPEQNPGMSDRIRILRIVLISGLMVVHLPPTWAPGVPWGGSMVFAFLHTLLGQVVFMAALPMLSVISGYLYAGSTRRYSDVLRRKLWTLVLPFLLWNLPLVAAVYAVQVSGWGGAFGTQLVPFDFRTWMNAALGITQPPLNGPLYFLRDLFACFLAGPLILAASRSRLAPLAGAGLVLLVGFRIETGLWVREAILMWFFLGTWLRRLDDPTPVLDHYRGILLTVYVLLTVGTAWLQVATSGGHPGFPYLVNILRGLSIPVFWTAAGWLQGTRTGEHFRRISGMAFLLFNGHSPLLLSSWYAAAASFRLEPDQPAYIFYTLLVLPGIWAGVYVFWRGMARYQPGLLRLLTGGRSHS